jgi:cytochrome c oxidase subunit 2
MYTRPTRGVVILSALAVVALAEPTRPFLSPASIFAPVSTPAQSIFDLSRFVLMVTGAIFSVVVIFLTYPVVKFRKTRESEMREPAQVYGSTQCY